MDTLNSAIESLMTASNKEDWPSVNMNVADATVTVISEQVRGPPGRLASVGHGEALPTTVSRQEPRLDLWGPVPAWG